MCGVLQAAFGLPLTYQPKQLTAVQQHIASCVRTLALRHFPTGGPVSISTPSNELQDTNATLSEDNQPMVNFVLGALNDMTRWPILVFTSDILADETSEEVIIPHSYIIFLWPQQDERIYDTIKTQMQDQQQNPSWNPRAKFLVVVIGHDSEPHMSVARHICEILWEVSKICNVVVLIPSSHEPSTMSFTPRMQMEGIKTFDLYTFFPYTAENCGKVTDVIVIDEWLLQKNGRFDRDADLFPPKIPDDFMGCPVRVSTIGFEPFVVLTQNHAQEDGSILYNVGGLLVDIFVESMVRMNTSVVFLSPEIDVSMTSFLKALTDQMEGLSDITVGFVPALPVTLLPGFVHTISYAGVIFTMFVPCPSRIHSMSKLFSIFTLPVWLTLALTVLFTSATFWCLESKSHRSESREPSTLTSIFVSVYNAWAILMAVSVPKMPNTWTHRILFLFYVCFSFAMVTVFQTFFVSYLVEPGYGKAIKTMQEALESDLLEGSHPSLRKLMDAFYFEHYHLSFPDSRRVKCFDLVECTKRMITQRDIFIANTDQYVKYIASVIGVVDYTKVICHVDDSSIYIHGVGLLHKGSPFLDGINKFMRRYVEGGIMAKNWAYTLFMGHLQSMGFNEFVEDSKGDFFVFSIHHLSAAFLILILGHIFSCIVFICEVIYKRASK
ncbi:hypothetical protein B7P43_G17654 [Cryptotermes secundus]|uniref:Ionotropic glutamate receptor C-terminal domain-containing protein n=1 Tax=Cryptotermes secundus TaxID=105785 RepID=A0A2J7PWK0_9NEOP|nr:hypothetical protein B7P43_G17654 [Cryptotermes secundus]